MSNGGWLVIGLDDMQVLQRSTGYRKGTGAVLGGALCALTLGGLGMVTAGQGDGYLTGGDVFVLAGLFGASVGAPAGAFAPPGEPFKAVVQGMGAGAVGGLVGGGMVASILDAEIDDTAALTIGSAIIGGITGLVVSQFDGHRLWQSVSLKAIRPPKGPLQMVLSLQRDGSQAPLSPFFRTNTL